MSEDNSLLVIVCNRKAPLLCESSLSELKINENILINYENKESKVSVSDDLNVVIYDGELDRNKEMVVYSKLKVVDNGSLAETVDKIFIGKKENIIIEEKSIIRLFYWN